MPPRQHANPRKTENPLSLPLEFRQTRMVPFSARIEFLSLVRCLTKPAGHGGKEFRPDTRPRPRTLGNTDPARRLLRKEWNALVKVHIPALNAAHQLLLLAYGAGRTLVGADLAGGAEFICAEAVGRSGNERHIRRDARQTYSRSELAADQ